MDNQIFNIEPFLGVYKELNFSEFYKYKLDNPRFHQIRFEEELRSFLDTNKEVCVLNSGTASIHLALKLANVEPGDVVFCSASSFIASANPILYCRAKPYFVDVEFETGNMNPDYLEKAILKSLSNGDKPKAVIVVHSYGVPANMDKLLSIKDKYGLILIEDAAEALGSMYNSNYCGTIGDIGIFSFNSNKLVTTFGGGCILVNSLDDKRKVEAWSTQARREGVNYIHSELGFNYAINDLAAYLGWNQMSHLKMEIDKKRTIYYWYKVFFGDNNKLSLLFEDNDEIFLNRWMNCIEISDELNLDNLIKEMESRNIEVRRFWYPLNEQPYLLDYCYMGNNESRKLYEKVLCLPSGVGLLQKDVLRIVNTIESVIF